MTSAAFVLVNHAAEYSAPIRTIEPEIGTNARELDMPHALEWAVTDLLRVDRTTLLQLAAVRRW